MIIGIAGKKQSGKDTVAKIIQYLITKDEFGYKHPPTINDMESFFNNNHKSRWKIHRFADKLKDIVCLLIGCTREQLEDEEFKNTPLGSEWTETVDWGDYDWLDTNFVMTPRTMLQFIGTDLFRNRLHPNTWVNATMIGYKSLTSIQNGIMDMETGKVEIIGGKTPIEYPNWIIPDVRFPNEVKAIKARDGIIIRLQRHTDIVDNHLSETALDEYDGYDYVISNNGTITDLITKVNETLKKAKIL